MKALQELTKKSGGKQALIRKIDILLMSMVNYQGNNSSHTLRWDYAYTFLLKKAIATGLPYTVSINTDDLLDITEANEDELVGHLEELQERLVTHYEYSYSDERARDFLLLGALVDAIKSDFESEKKRLEETMKYADKVIEEVKANKKRDDEIKNGRKVLKAYWKKYQSERTIEIYNAFFEQAQYYHELINA